MPFSIRCSSRLVLVAVALGLSWLDPSADTSMAIPIIPIAMGVASLLGGIGKKRSEDKALQTQNTLTQDQLALQRYQAEQQARNQSAQNELQQRQFALAAPGARLSNSLRGSLAANAQPGRVSHPRANVVNFNSPLGMLSPETRQQGSALTKQMLLEQMRGDPIAPMGVPGAPQASPLPKSNLFDKIAGVAGGIASGIAGIGTMMNQPPSGPAPNLPYRNGIDPIGQYGTNMTGLYR